jgi:cytoskeletal protein CcmA (bactofilin family)
VRRSAYAHRGVGDIDAVHDVEILGHSCGTGDMHCENICTHRRSGVCLCGTAASRSEEASSVRLVHHHEGLVHSKRGAS